MNILEIEDMVKGLPDDRLQQEAEMPTGQVPQFLVVSEIQRRADMRKRFSERQQEQPQGTVKDQIVQEGIAAMAPPEPQMQAAMMGGPQPMPPQMPMQPEGPMPPQMPMAPQGPMPPQGMAEGGVVRMQEGLLTPYATALTNYQSLIEPLSQQLTMLQNQGGNVDKILDLEGQMRSIYENLGLDRYSLDERRAALSDSSPEEIQSAYNRAGLNPDRYADIVGSIGTYAGEGEDNQDVNLPTATTPIAQEEPSDAKEAFIRGEINTRSNPEGQFVASVDGPGTRDASSLIPRLEMQAAAPIDPESTTPERMQQRMRDIAAAKLNFLRRGDVQYDEEDLLRFAPSGPFFDASINQGGFEMATSPVARRLNSTLDRLEATSPTAKLARSLAAPAANDDRTQSIDVGGPLFGPAYTPRLASLGAGASGMSGNVAEITRGEADKIQLSGAVTTDAKRGLSTGTALDPEVLRLATAPDSSGGLQSIIGPRSGSNVADITRTEVESVEGVSTVRGGDASVQGPTGRQRAVATSTDASGPGGIPLPLYLRVLTSALGSNTSIDDSRRTNLKNLIASAETKDNQGPLFGPDFTPKFGPDFTPKFGPDFTPKFGPPVPPGLGEQGPDFGPPIPPDVRVDGPAFGPDFMPTEDSQTVPGINRDLISRLIRDPESVDFGTSLYKDAIRTAETTGTQKKGSTSGKILAPIEGSTIEEIANNIYSYRQPVIQSRRGSKPDNKYESREELFLRVFGEDAPGDALDAARSAYDLKFRAPYSPRFTDYALGSNALDQYLVAADKEKPGEAVAKGQVDTSREEAGTVTTETVPDGKSVATVDQAGGDKTGVTSEEDQFSFEFDNKFITGGGSEKYQEFISELERRDKALADRIRDQKAPSLDYSGLISESQARLDQQLEAIKSEKGAQALIALGAGIARGDLGAGLSDAGKAVAASNAQKRALQARQQALEAGLKKSQVDAVFQQAIRQEENQIKAEEMTLRAFEREGVRTRDAEKFVMDFSLKVNQLKAQIKRWDALTEENKQRLRGQILSYVQSGLSGQYFPATDPGARERATNELIKQAAAIIGVNPTELGVAPSEIADTGGSEKRFGVTEVPDKGAT